jgi:mRNA interferase RelE/StbE
MYRIRVEKKAAEFFRKLDSFNQERIGRRIEQLKTNPRLGVPLTGNLTGLWKLRVGDYRVIYHLNDSELVVAIIKMGHRRNVYD